MNHCPNCGALISDGQDKCSICNTPITNNNQTNNEQVDNNFQINSLFNNQEPIKNVYEPLPEVNNDNNLVQEEVKEDTNIERSKDDIKKNIMSDILKEHEEKTKKEVKDDSYKAAILSIIVVIIIIVGGYLGVKYGLTSINNGDEKVINTVAEQAKNYTIVLNNYMKKYNYKEDKINQASYVTRTTTYNFLDAPANKCIFKDGVWSGSDNDEVSCNKFFSDINDNYCHNLACDIPSEAEIYLKEILITDKVDNEEISITVSSVADGTTLTYDDIECTLTNNNYNCKYKEK